jgi:hypothetical protein
MLVFGPAIYYGRFFRILFIQLLVISQSLKIILVYRASQLYLDRFNGRAVLKENINLIADIIAEEMDIAVLALICPGLEKLGNNEILKQRCLALCISKRYAANPQSVKYSLGDLISRLPKLA